MENSGKDVRGREAGCPSDAVYRKWRSFWLIHDIFLHEILWLVFVQGGEDKLVDPAGAEMLYDKASSKDKTIKFYDGLYHEVFTEPYRARVLKDVETWLATHI